MTLVSFLKLVEIQTKAASIVPFLLGTLYSVYRFGRFKPGNFIMIFISLIAIDMATTAINNYYDYKRALKTHGYNYESHNAIVSYSLKESAVVFLTLIPVSRNIRSFYEKQTQKDTFILAVNNFLIINVAQALIIGGGALVQKFI